MVAISRIEVDHDGHGGTAPDAMVRDKGGIIKPRASSLRVTVDHASLPGPPGFWTALGVGCPSLLSFRRMWLFGSAVFLEFSSFVATIHWPQSAADLGKIGISYLELLILFEHVQKSFASTSEHEGPWWVPASQPAVGMISGEGASSFMVCSGLWATFLEV